MTLEHHTFSPGSLSEFNLDSFEGCRRTHKLLKASGRRVESAQQIAQILEWPTLTPDEPVDLDKILFNHQKQDEWSIDDLAKRMTFRLQGLKPDPIVPVPESTEWFVQKYAHESYKPKRIAGVQ